MILLYDFVYLYYNPINKLDLFYVTELITLISGRTAMQLFILCGIVLNNQRLQLSKQKMNHVMAGVDKLSSLLLVLLCLGLTSWYCLILRDFKFV